jgi:hypothetical protein
MAISCGQAAYAPPNMRRREEQVRAIQFRQSGRARGWRVQPRLNQSKKQGQLRSNNRADICSWCWLPQFLQNNKSNNQNAWARQRARICVRRCSQRGHSLAMPNCAAKTDQPRRLITHRIYARRIPPRQNLLLAREQFTPGPVCATNKSECGQTDPGNWTRRLRRNGERRIH